MDNSDHKIWQVIAYEYNDWAHLKNVYLSEKKHPKTSYNFIPAALLPTTNVLREAASVAAGHRFWFMRIMANTTTIITFLVFSFV